MKNTATILSDLYTWALERNVQDFKVEVLEHSIEVSVRFRSREDGRKYGNLTCFTAEFMLDAICDPALIGRLMDNSLFRRRE